MTSEHRVLCVLGQPEVARFIEAAGAVWPFSSVAVRDAGATWMYAITEGRYTMQFSTPKPLLSTSTPLHQSARIARRLVMRGEW